MNNQIIIKALQVYITRKKQKLCRLNRIIEREPNADNLSNLKKGLRLNNCLIKKAEFELKYFETLNN